MSESLPRPPRRDGRISLGLKALLADTPGAEVSLRELFAHLEGRGHAALMVVMAAFTWLPAVSVVTGPILVFVGLRFSFGQRPWLPAWLLNRAVQRGTVSSLAERCESIERRTARILRPRWTGIVSNVWLHRALGVAVAICGALLPLPIPLTNIPLALPVLIIGLSLIEDDGLYALAGLALALVVFASLAVATWFGGAGVEHLWHHFFGGPPAGP